jgi:ribosomal protein S18 acetylase RimI-like enzyme
VLTIEVRRAVPDDGRAIAAVQRAAWQSTYQGWIPDIVDRFDTEKTAANWARAAADPGQHVTVATVDGVVVAYALTGIPEPDSVEPEDDPDRTGELHALYAHPDVHGQGLGRLLVADALRTLARRRREHCVLWAIERNPRSRGFYEHLGFTLYPGASRLWRGLPEVRYRRRTADC